MGYQMSLAELLPDKVSRGVNPTISGLHSDSRAVEPGDLFVALAGQSSHGLSFAKNALERGCNAVVYDPQDAPSINLDHCLVPVEPVEKLGQQLGSVADRFFRSPSRDLSLVGVTGTNGKSSFVHLLGQSLDRPDAPCGTLGTLGYGLVGHLSPAPLTTPDVITVHRELAKIRDQRGATVVMEVSSHALDQGRVDGVAFDAAVFTNLSRDHLDYHGDMASYGQAKSRLFQWPNLRFAIVNVDDAFGCGLTELLADEVAVIGYGLNRGDVRATELRANSSGTTYQLATPWGSAPIASRLLGRFNVYNQLAVAATLGALGLPIEQIGLALQQAQPAPGRMQAFGGVGEPLVVVDYAHTPDALEQALQALRGHCEGRLVCVFGCGGDRDQGKRPLMAEVAERVADGVIVTDDNPRAEDGDRIMGQILAGFVDPAMVLVERDRAAAIQTAIATAEAGDVVLVAGKGHEDYQEVDGQRFPFDDRALVGELLGQQS